MMIAGACDTHCHVFGPAARFPFSPDSAYRPDDAPASDLFALHRALGVDRGVILQATCHGMDNSAMLDALSRGDGRYRGVAMVDRTLTRRRALELHASGVRGARFSFLPKLGPPPPRADLDHVIDVIGPLGWHLDLLIDAVELDAQSAFLTSLPLPFVLDHMGRVRAADGPEQRPFEALLALMTLGNAWVKISGLERASLTGAPFADMAPFAQRLIAAAPDRVLWGTDWPHPNVAPPLPDDRDLAAAVTLFVPDASARTRLLVDNPARLYGFDAD